MGGPRACRGKRCERLKVVPLRGQGSVRAAVGAAEFGGYKARLSCARSLRLRSRTIAGPVGPFSRKTSCPGGHLPGASATPSDGRGRPGGHRPGTKAVEVPSSGCARLIFYHACKGRPPNPGPKTLLAGIGDSYSETRTCKALRGAAPLPFGMRVNNPARTRTMAASTLVKNRRDLLRRNDGVAFRRTEPFAAGGTGGSRFLVRFKTKEKNAYGH